MLFAATILRVTMKDNALIDHMHICEIEHVNMP